ISSSYPVYLHSFPTRRSSDLNLATSLGSALVGTLYVLDEPSIGLHPRDNLKLITLLKNLRDIGNSVLVVEHDPDMMKHADILIRSEEHTSELQSRENLVCRLL